MSTILGLDQTEDKHTLYHGKDCMKIFCTSLREHAKNISDFKKKKRLPLTKEELILHQDAKVCYICGKRILKKLSKSIYYRKGRVIAIIQVNIELQHIIFVIQNLVCLMKSLYFSERFELLLSFYH